MTESQTEAAPAEPHESWVRPIWEFLVHAVVGTTLFCLIAFPALGINFLVHYLSENFQLSRVLLGAMILVEYALLATDVVLFLIFMYRSAKRAIPRL